MLIKVNAAVGLKPVPGAAPLPSHAALQAGFAPLGIYGQSGPSPATGVSGPSSLVAIRLAGESDGQRLARLWRDTIAGKPQTVELDDVMRLQSLALSTIQELFTNQFWSDVELKEQVARKQPFFAPLDPALAEAILGDTTPTTRQQDALNFTLRTFTARDEGDSSLRRAVIDKLALMARRSDIAAIFPYLRKGDSSDLYHGVEAIKAITTTQGLPFERRSLADDPLIGPLLQRSTLSAEDRTSVIEAVLERGAIEKIEPYLGGSNSFPVYFVTFRDTLPGKGGGREQIEGVFKPEQVWPGKDRAFFPREVAVYQFDRRLTKTGLVPPTIEALIALPDEPGAQIGSLQYKLPNASPLGGRAPGTSYPTPANWLDPRWEEFSRSEQFQKRMAQVRTLAYVFNDPDKLANNVFPVDNFGNLLVVRLEDGSLDLRMIDNALGAGRNVAQGLDVDPTVLPKIPEPGITAAISDAAGGPAQALLSVFVQDEDAEMVAGRVNAVSRELDQRGKGDGG